MKRYAVGVAIHDGEIVVKIVWATDEIKAMMRAVQEEQISFVEEELGEDEAKIARSEIEHDDSTMEFSSIEQVIEYFYKGDTHVSRPVEIREHDLPTIEEGVEGVKELLDRYEQKWSKYK
ncbi:hypothetical protein [Shouchella clausii]|nr:hypothetical protein [Shouchella clausii]AST97325.1 hypothetical protein BC8716_15730 [Shouchella clausii]MCR1287887.1 hypothetical protein [Shouchella clausii]MCY1106483.1 hypothetical protein [Shouchella clausii]MEB5473233.1 hypothetical protein [Shouchella clausii]QNM43681.1 hypothetical protein DUT88_12595 [Shouchella clausii]